MARYELTREATEGFQGKRMETKVVEVGDKETPPEGAQPVADDTPEHDWQTEVP
jgi:hypothetical protein